MPRKTALILTLAAWLCATGTQWDFVQVFAWGKMIANYSQTMPLLSAVKKTFTTEGMCGVCEIVQESNKDFAGHTLPGTKAPEKAICGVHVPAPLVFGPSLVPGGLLLPLSTLASVDPDAPPLPPPRVLV